MLAIPDEHVGKLAGCPNCKAKVRVPAQSVPAPPAEPPRRPKKEEPRQQAREVEPIEDEDEEDEDEPRPKKRKRRRDDEDEDAGWLNANRIRGIVALVMSVGILIFALTFEKFKDPNVVGGEYGTPVGCALAGVMFVAGLFYLIRG
jgi:hypothetical protein